MTAIVLGILRHFLTVFGGYLFNRGLIDGAEQEQLIAALMVIAGIAWSVYNKIRSNKVKTPTGGYQPLPIVLLLLGALALSGCANLLATSAHNSRVREAQALRIQANKDGEIFAGVDFLRAPGWIGAWREEPGLMSLATLADVVTGLGAYYLFQNESNSDESTEVSVTGDGNRVNIGGRDASSRDSTRTSSTTSTGGY